MKSKKGRYRILKTTYSNGKIDWEILYKNRIVFNPAIILVATLFLPVFIMRFKFNSPNKWKLGFQRLDCAESEEGAREKIKHHIELDNHLWREQKLAKKLKAESPTSKEESLTIVKTKIIRR